MAQTTVTLPNGSTVIHSSSGTVPAHTPHPEALTEQNIANLAVAVAAMASGSGGQVFTDDSLLRLGTDGDQVLLNRSAALNAATALTSAIVGTPVTAAIPANSLIVSSITADGDQVFIGQTGGHSQEWARYDSSAKLIVFNEAAGDVDLRAEGDNNANMIVMDAGTDSLALGRAVVAGAFLSLDGAAVNRAGVTSVGRHLHIPTVTVTQTNADPTTLAIAAGVFVGIATLAGSAANQTITTAASVYIAGAPAQGTNVSLGTGYALWVDDGATRLDGALTAASLNLGGATLLDVLTATAVLDFGSIAAGASADLTIAVTGAAVGDAVFVGLPAAPAANMAFNGFVSAADTVTIRAYNNNLVAATDPDSATYRVVVFRI